jgi:hypothetical protein
MMEKGGVGVMLGRARGSITVDVFVSRVKCRRSFTYEEVVNRYFLLNKSRYTNVSIGYH